MNRIGIIGAMDEEVDILVELMDIKETIEKASLKFYKGTLEGKDIVLVRCGIGKVNSALCAQILISEFNVDAVVNTGVCLLYTSLRANAPSLHIIKADISTEVSPIVGNQTQGEEMIKYLLDTFEENPSELWASNMFGKSLNDLVKEQLQSKLYTICLLYTSRCV